MEQVTELYRFVKYMIQLYLQRIKDLSDEELHLLISTLNMTILKNGSRLENPKETSIDNLSTSINARSSVINLCEDLLAGDNEARKRWGKLLQKRKATGEPYILFKGNTNKQNPSAYKDNALKVHMTNICSEIVHYIQMKIIHSFVVYLA